METPARRFSDDPAVMRHAIALAARGIGFVESNPPVGAVIVDAQRNLLGEGWHKEFGGPHAEVHALEHVGEEARGATLFVTLEPCCHFGKTPPCAQTVIDAGIQRVVIACRDPHPAVDGGGIQQMEAAGIDVEIGLLKREAVRVMAPFLKRQISKRPYVHAKWAMTLDGRIASRTGHSQWISNEQSRAKVHQLRGRMDAILVGRGTVTADNPLLTARPPGPRVPLRVVLDSQAELDVNSQLVRTIDQAPLLVACSQSAPDQSIEQLRQVGVEVWQSAEAECVGVIELLDELSRRDVTNLLVEGGSDVLGSFLDAGEIDEVHVFLAGKLVGGVDAIPAVAGVGAENIPQLAQFDDVRVEILNGDVYWTGSAIPNWLDELN